MANQNRDLEFILKFKNEAKTALKQAQADLKSLGTTAAQVGTQMRQFNSANLSTQLALDKQAISAAKTQIAQQQLAAQTAKTTIETNKLMFADQKLALEEAKLAFQTEKLAFQQQRLAEAKDKAARKANFFTGTLFALTRQLIPLSAGYAALKAINLADDFVLMKGRIDLATRSVQESKYAFEGLIGISRETGASMQGTVSVFQRLSFVRDEIKATTDEMLQFTETVSKLGVISGATPDALKFGLTQLGQSLSSSLVRAEEFNSIMENIPAVGKQIADEMGITTGQLRLLVIEGKVLSSDVFAAILNSTEKVRAEFDRFPETVGRAFQGLLIDLGFAVDGINKTSNASKILIEILYRTGKGIKAIADLLVAYTEVFKAAFAAIVGGIVETYLKAANAIEEITNFVIKGLNLIKKDNIALVDFGIEPKDFSAAVQEDFNKHLDAAGDAFKDAFENGGLALVGEGFKDLTFYGEKVIETNEGVSAGTRKLQRDYKAMAEALSETNKKAASFYQTLQEQIDTMREEAKWVGRSNKERERAIALLKVQQDAIKAGITNFDPTEFLAAYDALQEAKERIHTDFGTGLQVAMNEMNENLKGAGDLAQDIVHGMADGIASTFKGLFDGSIKNAEDFRAKMADIFSSLAGQIAEYLAYQALIKPLLGAFGFGFGGGGGSSIANPNIAGTSYLMSAKGNAFWGGVHMFAKGGILNGPTMFSHNGGIGIGGEAGDEGLLPLKRMSNGVLGVQASGGNAAQINYAPVFQFNIEGGGSSQGGGGGIDKQAVDQLMRTMDNETRKLVYEIIEREQRPGGRLAGGK